MLKRVRVIVEGSDRELAVAEVADRAIPRLVGLLGRSGLAEGDGLVLKPCSSIHTCFMRFPIDVLFLDAEGTILRVARAVTPYRAAAGGWRARIAVELPAGTAARAGVQPGARVRLEPI